MILSWPEYVQIQTETIGKGAFELVYQCTVQTETSSQCHFFQAVIIVCYGYLQGSAADLRFRGRTYKHVSLTYLLGITEENFSMII